MIVPPYVSSTFELVIPSDRHRRSGEPWTGAERHWRRYGPAILSAAAVCTCLAALARVGHGLFRLTPLGDWRGGIDLRFRWHEVGAWFSGLGVYGRLETADYPPASYALLWPFVGGVEFETARWIWAVVSVLSLGGFAWLLWREAEGRSRTVRLVLAGLPLAGYATHGMLVTGQVGALALAAMLAGTLILLRGRSLWSDLLGASLVIVGLVKPTLAVPLVFVALLVPGRIRPAAFIAGGYGALTLFAASFQPAGILDLVQGWLAQGDRVTVSATYGNLQLALSSAGASDFFLPVVMIVCIAAGLWVHRHREAPPWLLLGAMAVVARLLTYHRSFDDLLIVLPIFALVQVAASGREASTRVGAGVLSAALWSGALAPRMALGEYASALLLLNAVLTLLWMAALAFLVREAHRHRVEERIEQSRRLRERLVAA